MILLSVTQRRRISARQKGECAMLQTIEPSTVRGFDRGADLNISPPSTMSIIWASPGRDGPSLSNGGRTAIGYLRGDNRDQIGHSFAGGQRDSLTMVGPSHDPFPSERGDLCLPDATSPLGKGTRGACWQVYRSGISKLMTDKRKSLRT